MDINLPCSLMAPDPFCLRQSNHSISKDKPFLDRRFICCKSISKAFRLSTLARKRSSLLASLPAFTYFSSLPAYNLRCCWSTDSFTLHREKESEPTIIYLIRHHCQIASPGNKSPLLAILLPLSDSFASPGPETSLLLVLPTAPSFASPGPETSLILVLPMAHSFALALPTQLPQIKIVWAIDWSAEIDVIGI